MEKPKCGLNALTRAQVCNDKENRNKNTTKPSILYSHERFSVLVVMHYLRIFG
jgi:hypothetical protein